MRVGLNAEPLFQRIPTGVGVYALALCRALVEIGHAADLVFFHADHDEAPSEMDALPVDRVGFTLSRDRLYDAWMADRRPAPQSITGRSTSSIRPAPPFRRRGGAALVVTVHDLAPIRFPDRYPPPGPGPPQAGRPHRRRRSGPHHLPVPLHRPRRRGVLRRRAGTDPGGAPRRRRAAGSVRPHLSVDDAGGRWERRGITEPYVLWVGTQEQRKNVVAVLDAFTHLAARHPELSLVLHGPNGWLGDEVGEGLQHRGLHGRTIVSEGSLPRNELAALYARASVFVYPSLYEGFGMPVLEAMACGTPVVTSNISALPRDGRRRRPAGRPPRRRGAGRGDRAHRRGSRPGGGPVPPRSEAGQGPHVGRRPPHLGDLRGGLADVAVRAAGLPSSSTTTPERPSPPAWPRCWPRSRRPSWWWSTTIPPTVPSTPSPGAPRGPGRAGGRQPRLRPGRQPRHRRHRRAGGRRPQPRHRALPRRGRGAHRAVPGGARPRSRRPLPHQP